jgi:hypothetical protein
MGRNTKTPLDPYMTSRASFNTQNIDLCQHMLYTFALSLCTGLPMCQVNTPRTTHPFSLTDRSVGVPIRINNRRAQLAVVLLGLLKNTLIR